jgi:transcriptional regulator with XRE-family HTH domain
VSEKEFLFRLGARIRSMRMKKAITQTELANKCGFDKANMSKIESGNSNLTALTMYKISAALEIAADQLFRTE